jgi:deoxyribose-phosphate aldolase
MTKKWTKEYIAGTIDHTILKAVATADDVKKLCGEAKEYGFASICVNPCFVPLVAGELKGSDVLTCTVIGFPLGANTRDVKAEEARLAVSQGAEEVDMVINVGALKHGDEKTVFEDIKAVVDASGEAGVKVILETCYLSDEEKKKACALTIKAGADFVKTSTGFGTGGATLDDIRLMREAVGNKIKIKASGGIGNLEDAVSMLKAGADRIGASAGVSIISEIK